ncbi:hypothetical protein EK21DRAFT_100538 [Setomelanomma holmii]|uniref:BRCT domain-containing protein n=1 Tax=Setomelanomma holmii TaxID=210430 RepID=A0A9P4HAT5_9PLEO|nr:hypothetical protein EK21DRAFT_100538 [Setomelanomma holmii]
MVATRRGAKSAPKVAPAPSNTLSAPPKRGGKKAVAKEVAAPAPANTKTTKTTATKRKAKAEPEDVELPAAKKPTANTKATRAAKVEMKVEPKPAVPKRATRGKKVAEPVITEEPEIVEEAPKSATTRGRKAATKKIAAPKVELPPVVEEPAVGEPIFKERPKLAPRSRRAPAKKATIVKPAVAEEPVAVEVVKPAARARKAAAPKPSLPTPAAASKPTRGRAAIVAPQDSPLKKPARKPAKKAATVAAKSETLAVPTPAPVEEPFSQFPGYPSTPAHIVAPLTSRRAMAELPNYPNTPAHILAPISNKDALAALPDYPKTPAHIMAPMGTKAALDELPSYPKTPAHIKAPISTPAHITAPVLPMIAENDEDALNELPGYPKTPAHIQAPMSLRKALVELPIDYVQTPARSVIKTPSTIGLSKLPADCSATPAHISSPVVAEETSNEPANGPQTPTQIVWGVNNKEAFEELPEYPKMPNHITAPVSNKDALAELPSYPATPAMALEFALQEEISASVKKQTPSPLHRASLADISFDFAEGSEITDQDTMDVDTEVSMAEPAPKLQLAPVQLNATLPALDMASPKKSALRSPQKLEAKTPKKAVTWNDKDESDLFLYDGARPLQGLTFFVDVTSNGKEHNYVFIQLLEDLGAKVPRQFEDGITHVLFKDGGVPTLGKVLASKGAIKCVNVGWVLECESNRKRVDETPYLVDLSPAMPKSPSPAKTMNPFTPARTPSRYALPPSSQCNSIPTTPTSSEFDRSINVDDDKENFEVGLFFQDMLGIKGQAPRTCPQQKTSILFSRSAMKTPSKPNFLGNSPTKPFSTTKKRSHESSFSSLSMSGQPKKLRLF